MNLNQLEYFLSVAETNSFTKAAEFLFISQPSLSVSIQKLEEELGVKLFERVKKRIYLTSSGKHFQAEAKEILARIETAKQELRQNSTSKQILKLGVLQTLSLDCVVELVSKFNEFSSNILIEHKNGSIVELKKWLERGELDLIITIITEGVELNSSQILFQQNYSAAVAKNHSLVGKKSLSSKELNDFPLIDRTICEKREYIQKWLVKKGIYPKIYYRTAHDEFCKALVAAGNGLAIMPASSNASNIVYLPFSDLNLNRQIGLVWRSKQNANVISRFCEFLTSHFASKKAFCN